MVVISCTKEDCNWKTTDRDASLATVLAAELQNHTAVSHPAPAPATGPNDNTGRKAPPIELWLMFVKKWDMFKAGSKIPPAKLTNQLFQCCVDSLGDDILRGLDDVATVSETDLLAAIKKLSVQPVAIGVRCTELLNMSQDREEPIRIFLAKVKGVNCSCAPPTKVDYTDCVIKDVILNGLVDDTVTRIESKEMRCHRLQGLLEYHRSKRKVPPELQRTKSCRQ